MSDCKCEMKGWCAKYQRKMTKRDHEICRGINISDRLAEKYKSNWAMLSSSGIAPAEEPKQSSGGCRSCRQSTTIRKSINDGLRPLRPHVKRKWQNSFEHTCIFLGEDHGDTGIHKCNHDGHDLCVIKDAHLANAENKHRIQVCSRCPHNTKTPRFIRTSQLEQDVLTLVSKLPPDITAVAGVARSGLHVATLVSMYLHVPMFNIRQVQGDVVPSGNGWRMTQGAPRATSGRIAIIDDTVMTGNSLRAIEALVAKEFPNSITAAVYVNPLAVKKPDVWAVDLPWPHILEWNIFNSVLLPAVAVDFDGILCHDCHPADDDDGPRYMSFLENTKPMYLARRGPIPLIVTARLEKYRAVTERWLNKWGMRANRLIMGHWSSLHERNRSDVAAYKAKHFMDFMRHHTGIKPAMFIESDPRQAERIASLSRGVVVCPAAGRCY